jgi:hypothetical protein
MWLRNHPISVSESVGIKRSMSLFRCYAYNTALLVRCSITFRSEVSALRAGKWCQGIMRFHNFCGTTTTGVNENFNKTTKAMLDRLGGHKHCWRLDKLIYHLMSTVMPHHIQKVTMAVSGDVQQQNDSMGNVMLVRSTM